MTTTTTNRGLLIGKTSVHSAAQAMTLIAYGDSSNGEKAGIPFRCLDFRTECEDYADFELCINIIDQYNEFDAAQMHRSLSKFLNLSKYYNEGNPNNGRNFFKFEIAREGSPAFYVSFIPSFEKQVIDNGNVIPYSIEQFKTDMEILKDAINADEMDIEQDYRVIARFWFD